MVEHGALPRRDELATRYDQWATSALERVSSDDHRDVVRRYIRWHMQRRMNQMETVPHGTFHAASVSQAGGLGRRQPRRERGSHQLLPADQLPFPPVIPRKWMGSFVG